jgi:starch phosphorylase
MRQSKVDEQTRDLAAFISLALDEITMTIDASVTAWEKRDYWLKADRFRLEWEWTVILGEKLSTALIKDKLDDVPAIIIKIMDKLQNVKLPARALKITWLGQWELLEKKESPISYITNGIHLPTWQAPEIADLCERQKGTEWRQRQTESEFWNCVVTVPDEEFWNLRQKMKDRLLVAIQDRAQKRWMEGSVTTQQVIAMGSLLDPYALTIVFSRRFAEYKRPYLILSNPEKLKKIVTNPLRPVQIIFAGKSHPADYESKQLLKNAYQQVMDRGFQGRIAFVEDYDMLLARELVRGADVWLNNPRRLQEACGTSGMKASMNGVINLSVRDGWWDEAYNGYNGWAIDSFQGGSTTDEDKSDSDLIYHLLENRIVPLYYERDRKGIPHQWIKIAKEAIRTISPTYNACRMMREYAERMYRPAAEAAMSNH